MHNTPRRQRPSTPGALALMALLALCGTGAAQQPQPAAAPAQAQAAPGAAPAAPVAPAAEEYRYRIGPGDVIDVRIFGRADFSREGAVVDTRGFIRMPLIKEEIRAACRTEAELAAEIASVYKKFLKSPHIDVFVKQYNSEPVAVIGAVSTPARFQMQRPVRLLELLVLAGGPTPSAGRTVQVVHSAQGLAQTCDSAGSPGEAKAGSGSFRLSSTLRADEKNNPYLRPGDLVNIPEADKAQVIGNVRNPTLILLNEPVTISRALGMAGGLLPDTQKTKVRILRQPPGTGVQTEVLVDLAAIEKKQAPDEPLLPNDIVEIPTKTGFLPSLKKMATQGALPMLTQLPLRVIP